MSTKGISCVLTKEQRSVAKWWCSFLEVLSGNAVCKHRLVDPINLVGGRRGCRQSVVQVRGRSSTRPRRVGMRCQTKTPGSWGGGQRGFGLRHNKEKTRERVPCLGGGVMVPGCLLGVLSAMRTSVERPSVPPPGKITGPICSPWKGHLGFCFWFFVCFIPLTARGSDRGSDGDCLIGVCCFLFWKGSPSGAARGLDSGGGTGGRL